MVFEITMEMRLSGDGVAKQVFADMPMGSIDCSSVHHALEQHTDLLEWLLHKIRQVLRSDAEQCFE